MNISGPGRWRSIAWLYAGFVLTGLGTTLLGCVLPVLIVNWRMEDAGAGVLFAAQFAGASVGAALVGRNYFNSVLHGYVLMVASALSLACFDRSPHPVLFLTFGLGLGLTMTASSMFAGSLFPANRAAVLSLLNACWCLGAVLSPAAASLWTRSWPVRTLFFALAVAMATVFFTVRRIAPDVRAIDDDAPAAGGRSPLALIMAFALIAFLYVGVEASVGGWMMAYVRRLTAASGSWPPVAVSCFWIALLCGRLIAPGVLRRISEASLLTTVLLAACVSVLALMLSRAPFGIVLSAASTGLALGPVYPLCMARVLALAHDSPRTKWVFGTSGLGAALLPWLTGQLSTHSGSLSVALLIPLGALGTMLLLQLLTTRDLVFKMRKQIVLR